MVNAVDLSRDRRRRDMSGPKQAREGGGSSGESTVRSEEGAKERMAELRRWETARGGCSENWLSLSMPGSSCVADEGRAKARGGEGRGSEESAKRLEQKGVTLTYKDRLCLSMSTCSSQLCPPYDEASNVGRKRVHVAGSLQEEAGDEANKNPPPTASFKKKPTAPSETAATIKELGHSKETGRRTRIPERFLPIKKRRVSTECFLPFKKLRVSASPSSDHGRHMEPYDRNQGRLDDGVLAVLNPSHHHRTPTPPAVPAALNSGEPAAATFLLEKRVTLSDTSRAQHRFQLTLADMLTSAQPMQDLALLSHGNASIPVQVLDRMGNAYNLSFKFLSSSSRTYRFMGSDYTSFLAATGLRAGQTMRISALPRGANGELRLAFLNSDA